MNRGRIAALFGASVLYFVALYAYVPSLPAYVAERTSRLAAVGVVLSMYGLWQAVLRMPLGVVTTATGRNKPYLLGGVLLAGIGAVVMALGRSLGMLAFGRALTGVSAAVWVPMMVVFAGFFPHERTIFATSLLSFASSLGMMIGTGLTGFLETRGGTGLAFFAAAGLSIAASIIVAGVRIPRTDAGHRAQVTARSVLAIFRRRDVLVPSFTNALCQFGVWALTFGFMPL
ncbi:MAG: MFS transporter, partial [Spirochaetia bacterium]